MTREVRGLPGLDRCRVMGVVNVTPDSFSDGGRYLAPDAAVRHGMALLTAGADLLDVGGESTRPGASPTPVDVEWARIGPVVGELAAAGAVVSVDTMHAEVARRALDAGARIVNDVSGGRADPEMLPLVAEAGVPVVLMHWRGPSATMQSHATYTDVVAEVTAELRGRLDAATAAGVSPEQVILDPGIGFAKRPEHSWALLRHLDALAALGRPLLVGVSRKGFLGELLAAGSSAGGEDSDPRPPEGRDAASSVLAGLVAAAGAWGVRVHGAASAADAVRVAEAWRAASSGGST